MTIIQNYKLCGKYCHITQLDARKEENYNTAMSQPTDPDTLKIPAYLRKKTIVSHAKQKLILTALDRKEAGLSHKSHKALASSRHTKPNILSATPRTPSRSSTAPFTSLQSETRTTGKSHIYGAIAAQKFLKIGNVIHYLGKIGVAIIQLSTKLQQGDIILLEGEDYFFMQSVDEMQINRQPIKNAKKGDDIGIKVEFSVKTGVAVYKAEIN